MEVIPFPKKRNAAKNKLRSRRTKTTNMSAESDSKHSFLQQYFDAGLKYELIFYMLSTFTRLRRVLQH